MLILAPKPFMDDIDVFVNGFWGPCGVNDDVVVEHEVAELRLVALTFPIGREMEDVLFLPVVLPIFPVGEEVGVGIVGHAEIVVDVGAEEVAVRAVDGPADGGACVEVIVLVAAQSVENPSVDVHDGEEAGVELGERNQRVPGVVGRCEPRVLVRNPSCKVKKVLFVRILFVGFERGPLQGVGKREETGGVGGGVGGKEEIGAVVERVQFPVIVVDTLLLEAEGVHESTPVVVLLLALVRGDDVHILLEKNVVGEQLR